MHGTAADQAFVVCNFIRDYGAVWLRNFPNCAGRAHWQIAQLVRTRGDGVLFSSVRGKMDDIYGMDENTCVLRVQELIGAGLIAAEDKQIRSSTCLIATPTLIEIFDRHTLEAAEVLHNAARAIDPKIAKLARLSAGNHLNKEFLGFFSEFLELWNEYRLELLKRSIPTSPAQRLKALHALKTMPYWHIFMTAWIHRHSEGGAKRPYLLVDDFHGEIYEHIGVGMKATSGYVQDMIDWGFLRRLNKDDGVPRGKFAVCMEKSAFEIFQNAFAAAAELLVASARSLNHMSAAVAGGTAEVLQLRVIR